MKTFFQNLAMVVATYGIFGGWSFAPDTVLWTAYAQAVYAEANTLYPEAQREAPKPAPPARLFVSAEGRYAIKQGWLAGAGYEENKTATHGEAIQMIMQLTAMVPEDVVFFGDFDPEEPLDRGAFLSYLGIAFYNLPDEGILDMDISDVFDLEKPVTFGEMARAAYRLRGLNPH